MHNSNASPTIMRQRITRPTAKMMLTRALAHTYTHMKHVAVCGGQTAGNTCILAKYRSVQEC